jgi:peptidyl-prolyl cis-trans isomerase B (cyclophilin B)
LEWPFHRSRFLFTICRDTVITGREQEDLAVRPPPGTVLAACLCALVLSGPLSARSQESAAGTVATEPSARLETDHGAFVIRLRPDLAPGHVRHFIKVARAGGFDGTVFHRIVPRGIVQGGDPLSKDPTKKALYGTGGLGLLKAEFSTQPMARGSVAAVLRPSSRDSAGNQFFICLSDQPALTGKFTIFGEVASGMEAVDAIGASTLVGDRAADRIVIRKVTIEGASPLTAGPVR